MEHDRTAVPVRPATRRTDPVVYYPAFPNYRQSILAELAELRPGIRILGGIVGRQGLTPIESTDFPLLQQLPTKQLMGFSWNPGARKACHGRDAAVVVLAPATRSASTWLVLLSRRLMGRRTVLWGNCGKPGDRGIKRLAQEVMNRLSTHLMVYGHSEERSAAELGTRTSKISIVGNATRSLRELEGLLSAATPSFADRAVRAAREGVVLAYVGRLNPDKGVDHLIRAAATLVSRGIDASVLVVGSGPARDSLSELAQNLTITARFTGPVHDPTHLRQLLDGATMLIGPTEVGLMAVDALIHHVPVLVPDNPRRNGPEIEALTAGVNCLFFQPGSPTAIAEAVERWMAIAGQLDPQQAVRARGESLTEWTAEAVGRRICDVIEAERGKNERRGRFGGPRRSRPACGPGSRTRQESGIS